MGNENKAFATKMRDSWANIPKQSSASRANENLQIYLRIFIEKSFLSKAFMAPDNLR